MASSVKVTVVEHSPISPPPRSVPLTTLPLTFLDIPWLLFSPAQPLFFYDFPISTAHFTNLILPNLKHTLSLSLQHFFPLAGNLVTPPLSAEPRLEYAGDDSIFVTIAESTGDFKNLAANHPKMSRDFHGLVPVLRTEGKTQCLAIQITVFPQAGICMGFSLRCVVADWRTFNNFLKRWGYLSKNGDILKVNSFHDRSVIRDPIGLKSIFLTEWRNMLKYTCKEEIAKSNGSNWEMMMRATFVLGPKEMETIKKWISTRSAKLFGSVQLLISPYVVTCAFVWVCWMKTNWPMNEDEYVDHQSVHYFGFIAGGLTRLRYIVPDNYVGNCVGFGRASMTRKELVGRNGIVFAAKAIGDMIKKLNGDLLGGAENWISEWKVVRESELHLMVTGSPKVEQYGLDFGWGRPVKMEEVSIDNTRAISLCESREVVGGIEIGVALSRSKMDDFITLFDGGLNQCSIVNDS